MYIRSFFSFSNIVGVYLKVNMNMKFIFIIYCSRFTLTLEGAKIHFLTYPYTVQYVYLKILVAKSCLLNIAFGPNLEK